MQNRITQEFEKPALFAVNKVTTLVKESENRVDEAQKKINETKASSVSKGVQEIKIKGIAAAKKALDDAKREKKGFERVAVVVAEQKGLVAQQRANLENKQAEVKASKDILQREKEEFEKAERKIAEEKKEALTAIVKLRASLQEFKKYVGLFASKVTASIAEKTKELVARGLAWITGEPIPIPPLVKERVELQIKTLHESVTELKSTDARVTQTKDKLAKLYEQLKTNMIELDQAAKSLQEVEKELDDIDFAALEAM